MSRRRSPLLDSQGYDDNIIKLPDLPKQSTTKPCRACTDFKTWVRESQGEKNRSEASVREQPVRHDCPVDINELGRNSWSLLHTIAANFPEKPSNEQKSYINTFIASFSHLYPCEVCAYDLRKRIKKTPIQADSQHDLSQWMCSIHNQINKMLGKPIFDCSKVNERWRDGWKDGSCD